jgi:hypothetical protein
MSSVVNVFVLVAHLTLFRGVRKIVRTTITFVISARLYAWNNSSPTGRIFMKVHILVLKNCLENSSFVQIGQEWRALFMKTARYF